MRYELKALAVAVAALQLLATAPAAAEPRTWQVSGKVTEIYGDPEAITGYRVKIGDRFVIRQTFDSALGTTRPQTCEFTSRIWDGSIIETHVQVGKWKQTIVPEVLPGSIPPNYNNTIQIRDDCSGFDEYGMSMEDWYGPSSNRRWSKIVAHWDVAMYSPSDLIDGVAILDSPPNIRDYKPLDAAKLQLSLDNIGGVSAYIIGKLERLQDVTPGKFRNK